jgi:hypothetical protein
MPAARMMWMLRKRAEVRAPAAGPTANGPGAHHVTSCYATHRSGPEAPARRSGVRVDGVSRSLPFSDLLALTSSDMFLSVYVLIITVRMRSWLR